MLPNEKPDSWARFGGSCVAAIVTGGAARVLPRSRLDLRAARPPDVQRVRYAKPQFRRYGYAFGHEAS